MNMNLFRIAVAMVLLLGIGCSGDHPVTSMRASISDSSELFHRKVECEKYASKVEEQYRDIQRLGKKADLHSQEEWLQQFVVDRIFYSLKRNSCVCVVSSSAATTKGFDWVVVLDVLTKEELFNETYAPSSDGHAKEAKDIEEQVKRFE